MAFCAASLIGFAQVPGETVFKSYCSACHTITKGKLIGPDLADVHLRRTDEWLMQFIKSSQSVISSGDADAVAVFNEYNKTIMPDAPYSTDDIKDVINYIKTQSPSYVAAAENSTDVVEEEPEAPVRSVSESTEEEIKVGRLVFTGEVRLGSSGPACISCHNVKNNRLIGGGLLAKDLTDAFSRMNEAGIKAIITSPPFPAMKEAYQNAPLTDEETYNVTAFLKQADEDQFDQYPRNWQHFFLLAGGISFLVLLTIFSLVWSNRKKNAVNKRIFDRQVYS